MVEPDPYLHHRNIEEEEIFRAMPYTDLIKGVVETTAYAALPIGSYVVVDFETFS